MASGPRVLLPARGTLLVPDPNWFAGPVRFRRTGEQEWKEVPLLSGPEDNARGLGLAEMLRRSAEGRPYRASGTLALHVLEVMEAVRDSAGSGRTVLTVHRCPRPEAGAAL